MHFSKTLVSLALAALSIASPLAERDTDTARCYLVLRPSNDLGAAALQSSAEFAVTNTIAQHWPDKTVTIVKAYPLSRIEVVNWDLDITISVTDLEYFGIANFVSGWLYTTLDGGDIQYSVEHRFCRSA